MPQVRCQAKRILLKAGMPKVRRNIMNYNMEERLEADADKAEAEWAKAEKLLAKFKKKKKQIRRNPKMKTLRNALTALLTALLILGTLPFTALVADKTAGAPLQFKNGKFKILILSDIQDTNTPQQATVDLMNNAIDQTKPDFIALTGDNIAGWWKGSPRRRPRRQWILWAKPLTTARFPLPWCSATMTTRDCVTSKTA